MRIKAPTPDGVTLCRDEHGVVHITASDLPGAHWGIGYAHALDRGLQMCLMRLLGQGRAAECLDGSEATVEVDRFSRRMNWSGHMDDQLAALTPQTRTLLSDYCAGVNAHLTRKRRWEFRLLGYTPAPWTISDCLLIARMTGYLTLAQSQAEIERLFVELVQAGVCDEKLAALFPGCLDGFQRSLLDGVTLHERIVPEALRWLSPAPRMMASNNWVVAASHSRTGHALLSNDPHLEVNRLPNVWVEQVIELPDDTVLTANMPGIPAALVGRKRALSWGATYTFMDAVDSWVEDCRDGCFRREDRWEPFTARKERIDVKKGSPVEVIFYDNLHGTLDGDPHQPGRYLTTRWAPSDSGAASLNAAVAMWQAQTVEEGMAVLGQIESAWNWVLADTTGRIGYQMSGRCPIRHPDVTGFTPMPGWDPAYDWQGFAEPDDLPRQLDPPAGFIVTANQDLNHLGRIRPINMPMGDYRARRIADLLAAAPCDLETFRRIQMDTYSLQAEEMMSMLRPLVPAGADWAALREWDLHYTPDSLGARLFEAFYRELLVEMFAPGGIGEPVLRHLIDATGVFIDFYQNFDRLLCDPASPWLDGRTLEAVYRAALARVTPDGQPWQTDNAFTMTNILFGGKLPSWLGFDHGPIPLRGGRATPHQGQIYRSGERMTSFAPSLRIVADMGEDTLHTAMAGGPSDQRLSRWYVSEVARWLAGEHKILKRLSPLQG